MAIRTHASWLSHQHNYLDLDPTYKGAYGLPLLRMTFDWHGNDPRKMRNLNKRRTDIGRALRYHGMPEHAQRRVRRDGQRSVDKRRQ